MAREIMDVAGAWANAGRQLGGGQASFEEGQSKMSKALAEQAKLRADAESSQATAGLRAAQAEELRRRSQFHTPEFGSKIAQGLAGFTDPQAKAVESFLQRGDWGSTPEFVTMQEGDAPRPELPMATPEWATPQAMQRFNAGRTGHLLNLSGTGDSKADDTANAIAKLLGQGRIDTAMANPDTIPNLGAVMAASEGKPLYNNTAGGVMQNFTGAEMLNEIGRTAAKENTAQAANQYASADANRADAALKRSKVGQPQYVIGPDGEPVAVAPRGKMSSTEQKETFEADDLTAAGQNAIAMLKEATRLNSEAYSGFGAKTRAVIRSNLPGTDPAADATVNLDNLMTGQALEQLKATFGGAPTEGERKILMDLQASADKTPQQRKLILDRAISLAERRVNVNKEKAKALRDGSYLTSGYHVPDRKPSDAPAAPPSEAIAMLKANPNLAGAFAAKYGKAATDAALGKGR